jgi:hypothetical protein
VTPARPQPPIPIANPIMGNGVPLIDDAVVGALTRDVGTSRLGEVLGAFVSELSRRIPIVAPALAAAAYRANDAFRRNDADTLLDASEDVLRRAPETCAAVVGLIAAIDIETRDQGKGEAR